MLSCPKCFAKSPDDSSFCTQCGYSFSTEKTMAIPIEPPVLPPTEVVLKPKPAAKVLQPQQVVVTDIDMPFFSMMGFMLKWFFASLPVLFMIGVFVMIAGVMFSACVAGLGGAFSTPR